MGYNDEPQEVAFGMERNRLRVLRRYQVDSLVGRLLTYVEATYNDPQQRKAHKDIVKQTVYNWFMDSGNFGIDDIKLGELITHTLDNYHNGICLNCGKAPADVEDNALMSACSECPPARFKAANVVTSKKLPPLPPKPSETER